MTRLFRSLEERTETVAIKEEHIIIENMFNVNTARPQSAYNEVRTPIEIYTRYKIMRNLQLHQLRVAAVGKMICDNLFWPIDTNAVVVACLFHDMGNILKFNLAYFPESLEPEGLKYWENVKSEYTKKYGMNQHGATKKIAEEIGLQEAVIKCIDAVGFSKAGEVLKSDSYEKKICEYSDMRVGPHGVLSLEERVMDGRKRYLARGVSSQLSVLETADRFDELLMVSRELEKQIFASEGIKPEDITDSAIKETMEKLREYSV